MGLFHNNLIDSLVEHLRDSNKVVMTNITVGSRWLMSGAVPIPDVLMFRKSYTKPDLTVYEVKVTKTDFMQDVNEGKYRRYFDISNRLFFAYPSGLIAKKEVPEGCGLIVYNDESKSWSVVKSAKRRECNLEVMEWMSLLFALQDDQIRLRSLRERLVMNDNVKLEDIAKNLPQRFRDEIRRHTTAVETLEEHEKDLAEKLGCKAEWWWINERIDGLLRKEDWSDRLSVEFALAVLERTLDGKNKSWGYRDDEMLKKAEEYVKTLRGRKETAND